MQIEEIKYLIIRDPKLFEAVKKAWIYYRPKLELLPASFTGTHHPPCDQGIGGMKKHIENLCWFSHNYCIQLKKPYWFEDYLMVASFFHDISNCDLVNIEDKLEICEGKIKRKQIVTRQHGESYYHPLESAKIAEFYLKQEEVHEDIIKEICKAIERHMSHWYKALSQPETELEKTLSLGDYIVSRDDFRLEEKESYENKS